MTAPWPTSTSSQSETSDLREYVRPIWAHKILILVLVAVVTVGTYEYYNRKPRVYQTSTQVFVGSTDPSAGEVSSTASDRTVANESRLLQTPTVAAKVGKKLGIQGNAGGLLGAISVTPSTGTDFVSITATTGNPILGAEIANAFAKAFIEMRASNARAAINRKIATLQAQLGVTNLSRQKLDLQNQIEQARVSLATVTGDAQQVSPAVPIGTPISPHPRRNAIFGFALSLLLGIIAAFGLERVNRRIRTPEEAERAYGLPIVATIRHERDIAPRRDGKVSVADSVRETFRFLRSNLELATSRQPLRTILVTSAVPVEGKTTVVRNLALVYAEAGLRVAVIEADLRRPTLARMLNGEQSPGLANVLMGVKPLDEVIQSIEVHLPARPPAREAEGVSSGRGSVAVAVSVGSNGHGPTESVIGRLALIASGPRPADPPAMFSAPTLPSVLERVAADYDIVLIDSPPLLPVSDTLPLLSLVDGTLLVCRMGTTSVDGAERVLNLISRVPNARILGLVVNDVEGGVAERYQGY
jgi:Mrp family chromosome partitioning ATPase